MGAPAKNPSKPKLKADKASRSGGMDGPLQPSGLGGSKGASKSPAKKQIRWHHGAAAFVLKYDRMIAGQIKRRCFLCVPFSA